MNDDSVEQSFFSSHILPHSYTTFNLEPKVYSLIYYHEEEEKPFRERDMSLLWVGMVMGHFNIRYNKIKKKKYKDANLMY